MTVNRRTVEDSLEKLKLFNEKAQKLERSDFIKQMLAGGTSVEISLKQNKLIEVKSILPTEGAIDAFMNNYRFFCQNNEGSSFQNIQHVYDSLPISAEKKTKFNEARSNLNQYLDAPNTVNIIINNKELTRRELLDTLMYGMIVHSNKEKRKIVQQWMKDPILSSLIKQEFSAILASYTLNMSRKKKEAKPLQFKAGF